MKARKQYHGEAGRKSLNIIRRYFPAVEKLNDATKSAIIEVTNADSNGAELKNPALCAFAKACYRSFEADAVIIGLTTCYIIKGKVATRFHNTESVSREIISFDRKAGFTPGLYLISPAPPGSRLGIYKARDSHPKTGGRDRRRFRHVTTRVRVLGES